MHVATATRTGASFLSRARLPGLLVGVALVFAGCSTSPPGARDAGAGEAASESHVRVASSERVDIGNAGEQARPSYPNLGEVPERPTETLSTRARQEREALREGLIADTKRARYTEEALRARTSPASQPPVSFEPSSPPQEFARSPERIGPAMPAPSAPGEGTPAPVAAPVAPVSAAPVPAAVSPPPDVDIPRVQAPAAPAASAPQEAPSAATPGETATPRSGSRATAVPRLTPPPMPGQEQAAPQQNRQTAAARQPQEVRVPPQPSPPAAAPPVPDGYSEMQVGTIYFGNGSASLGDGDRVLVQQIAEAVAGKDVRLRIVGHSSRGGTGDAAHRQRVNYEMSRKRANAVAEELVRLGVPPGRLSIVAEGDGQPVYQETSPTGAAGNRRTEIFLLTPPRS